MVDLSACRIKAKTIKLVFVVIEIKQIGWLGIMIMCPSEATRLPAERCVSELAIQKIMVFPQ